jgi:hypothetical protein
MDEINQSLNIDVTSLLSNMKRADTAYNQRPTSSTSLMKEFNAEAMKMVSTLGQVRSPNVKMPTYDAGLLTGNAAKKAMDDFVNGTVEAEKAASSLGKKGKESIDGLTLESWPANKRSLIGRRSCNRSLTHGHRDGASRGMPATSLTERRARGHGTWGSRLSMRLISHKSLTKMYRGCLRSCKGIRITVNRASPTQACTRMSIGTVKTCCAFSTSRSNSESWRSRLQQVKCKTVKQCCNGPRSAVSWQQQHQQRRLTTT